MSFLSSIHSFGSGPAGTARVAAVALALALGVSAAVAGPAAATGGVPVFDQSVPTSIPIDGRNQSPLSVALKVEPTGATQFNVYYLDAAGATKYGFSMSSPDGRATATVLRSGLFYGLTAVFEATNAAGATRSDAPRSTPPAATPTPPGTVIVLPPDVTLPPPTQTPLAPTPPSPVTAPVFVNPPSAIHGTDPGGVMRWVEVPLRVTPEVSTSFATLYFWPDGTLKERSDLGTSPNGVFAARYLDAPSNAGTIIVFEATNAAGTTRSGALATTPTPAELTIVKQPIHAVGTRNSTVQLSVESNAVGATTTWQYRPGATWVPLEVGPNDTLLLTDDLHGKPFRAIVTDARGRPVTSEPRLIAIVAPPSTLEDISPAPVALAQNSSPFTVVAAGGYPNVARVVPELQYQSASGWVDGPSDPAYTPYLTADPNTVTSVAKSSFTNPMIGYTWRIAWKTCVIVADSTDRCAKEVPGASSQDAVVPPIAKPVIALQGPKLLANLPGVTYAQPGSEVGLSVTLTDYSAASTFTWQVSRDNQKSWSEMATHSSPTLLVGNATVEDKSWFRVEVSNEAGKVMSIASQVRAMRTDYSVSDSGFAPLWFVNMTTDEGNGDQKLLLVRGSGARELPNSNAFLELHTGQEVKTSWHWADIGGQFMDYRIGEGPWVVRVLYGITTVKCQFKLMTEDDRYLGSAESRNAPYACENWRGGDTVIENDPDAAWSGTRENREHSLKLVNRRSTPLDATVTLDDAPDLLAWACSSRWVGCSMNRTSSPESVQVPVSPMTRLGAVCPADPTKVYASADVSRQIQLSRATTLTWNESLSVSGGFEVKLDFGDLGLGGGVHVERRWDQGRWEQNSTTTSDTIKLGLQPGQVGYAMMTATSTVVKGDATLMIGKDRYFIPSMTFTTTGGTTGSQPFADLQPTFMIRPTGPADLANCELPELKDLKLK